MGTRDVESWSDWSAVGEDLRATLSAEPDLVGHEARVRAAFFALPPVWQSAVWLHEVEGAAPTAIGRRLGMSPSAARGVLRSARVALKRHVADQHEMHGGAECRALVSTYRSTPPAYLNRRDSSVLRDHARHCDGCLLLVQDIFILDRGLRHWLADLRPEEARPPVPASHRARGGKHAAPKSVGAGSVLTPARGRALAGGLSLAVAAVSVSVLLRPLDDPGSGPGEDLEADDLPDFTRPVAIASAEEDPGTRPDVAGRSSADGRANRSAVFARATESSRSSNGPADQQASSEPAAPAPTGSSTPPTSSEPESPAPPPSGDGSPPPDNDPPPADPPPSDPPPEDDPPPSDPPSDDDPPPSDGLPSVEAEVGDDGVTVTVDPEPVPADPVEVGIGLPE